MAETYHFGPFRYDAGQRMLYRGTEIVTLTPKMSDLLLALLERRGKVVDKAELMRLVWPDAVVEETGLARNVSLLRKALGDECEQYIQTAPKRGYRFVSESKPKGRRWWIAAAVLVAGLLIYWQFYAPSRYLPPGHVSLAVVPFERDDAGLSEMLVAELSKLPGVIVVNPSTIRRYQRVGFGMQVTARVLGLDVLVEGAVRKPGVTVRLVDVHSAKLIWAENYPAVEPGETARTISVQVGAHLMLRGKFPVSQ